MFPTKLLLQKGPFSQSRYPLFGGQFDSLDALLFVSQRRHGVDLGCSVCGNCRRNQSNCEY